MTKEITVGELIDELKEYLALCKLAYDEAMKEEDKFKNTNIRK